MMDGKLNAKYAADFKNIFRIHCLTLLAEAYQDLKDKLIVTIDWEEENISANIFNYIDRCTNSIVWNINISDEFRIYNDTILKGEKSAKTAPRIDLRLTTNWVEAEVKLLFYVEAKNLVENDYYKSGRQTKIYAKEKHERYINTGIDNFISNRYPYGCILGYVLLGNSNRIVDKINICLDNKSRTDEYLKPIENPVRNLEYCYQSTHCNGLELNHFLLQFSV